MIQHYFCDDLYTSPLHRQGALALGQKFWANQNHVCDQRSGIVFKRRACGRQVSYCPFTEWREDFRQRALIR